MQPTQEASGASACSESQEKKYALGSIMNPGLDGSNVHATLADRLEELGCNICARLSAGQGKASLTVTATLCSR